MHAFTFIFALSIFFSKNLISNEDDLSSILSSLPNKNYVLSNIPSEEIKWDFIGNKNDFIILFAKHLQPGEEISPILAMALDGSKGMNHSLKKILNQINFDTKIVYCENFPSLKFLYFITKLQELGIGNIESEWNELYLIPKEISKLSLYFSKEKNEVIHLSPQPSSPTSDILSPIGGSPLSSPNLNTPIVGKGKILYKGNSGKHQTIQIREYSLRNAKNKSLDFQSFQNLTSLFISNYSSKKFPKLSTLRNLKEVKILDSPILQSLSLGDFPDFLERLTISNTGVNEIRVVGEKTSSREIFNFIENNSNIMNGPFFNLKYLELSKNIDLTYNSAYFILQFTHNLEELNLNYFNELKSTQNMIGPQQNLIHQYFNSQNSSERNVLENISEMSSPEVVSNFYAGSILTNLFHELNKIHISKEAKKTEILLYNFYRFYLQMAYSMGKNITLRNLDSEPFLNKLKNELLISFELVHITDPILLNLKDISEIEKDIFIEYLASQLNLNNTSNTFVRILRGFIKNNNLQDPSLSEISNHIEFSFLPKLRTLSLYGIKENEISSSIKGLQRCPDFESWGQMKKVSLILNSLRIPFCDLRTGLRIHMDTRSDLEKEVEQKYLQFMEMN